MNSTYIGPTKIIEKKRQYLFPCSYHFYQNPPQIVQGKMQYLYDHNGKKYTDFFAGVSVMNCGHCNPTILQATINQMQQLQHTTTIYLTQPMVELAEKLAYVLPGNIQNSFFCNSGSEATEGALLLAKLYTGKSELISFKRGLHGRTHLTMSVTGIDMWRSAPDLVNVHFIEPAYSEGTYTDAEKEMLAKQSIIDLKQTIKKVGAENIAALIMEPIQGNGGIITPPLWFWKEVKAILEENNILMIADEIQTGFARTGKMFAVENFDVIPDIICTAKALGNGVPIAAFSTTATIASAFTKPSASTLGGNPVSAQTAIAVLDYMDKENLSQKAKLLGDQLKTGLQKLMKKYPLIVDVRGIGLMLGAELVRDGKPASKETDDILEKLMEKGFLIGKNGLGRNVLAFQPPLVITPQDIKALLKALDEVLERI